MAENIKLAEFDIDVDSVIKSAAELKRQIDSLKQSQKELKNSNEDTSEAFVSNDALLKTLNKEYREHIKVIQSDIDYTVQQATRTDLLNTALNQEVTTIAEAREQNKLLNKLRNDANATTSEGQEEIRQLNNALDANNDFIKDNVDALSQQKINVGNYSESIKDALKDLNPFNQSIFIFIENTKDAGGVLPYFQKGLKGVASGFVSATKAGLAFLATPIGAIIGTIGLALGLVVNALTSTQSGMDKVTAVTRPLTAVLEVLFGVIQDIGIGIIDAFENPLDTIDKVYSYIKDKVVKQFEALYDIVAGIVTLDFDQISKGLNGVADNVKETWNDVAGAAGKVGDEIQRGIDLGKELDRLTKEYERTQIRNAELLPQLNAQLREANKIAEDQTKTQAERQIAAAKTLELSKEINKAKKEELTLELAIAENEAARNDTSREDELAIADIKGKIYDADAQAAEQQTTQQNKLNTIRKDGAAKQKKIVDDAIVKQKELLDLFIAEQGERARTLEEELILEETASDKRKAILSAELEAKKLSHEAYKAELIKIDTDLARRRAEIAINNAQTEIEANVISLNARRENEGFLTEDLALKRIEENNNILLQQQELARLKLEKGLINQTDFDTQIRGLSEANRIANAEIDAEREALEKEEKAELRALEFEAELQRLYEEGATKFDLQQAQLDEQKELELSKLEEQKENSLISETLFNARKNEINKRYSNIKAQNEINNEKALAEQRLDLASSLFSSLANIVDKNSAFGKALAVSQAVINTYKGITSALETPSLAGKIAGVAMATSTGFSAVKNIIKTKVPKAEGGSISGGGSANISSTSDLSSLTSSDSSLTGVAASGDVTIQDKLESNAASSSLTDSVSEAVRIGAAKGTAEGSAEGITNLSDNKNIEKLSSF